MRTRAELVSIQALSAELFASAACCSRAAMRWDCESVEAEGEVCAARARGARQIRERRIAVQRSKCLDIRLVSLRRRQRMKNGILYLRGGRQGNSKFLWAVSGVS